MRGSESRVGEATGRYHGGSFRLFFWALGALLLVVPACYSPAVTDGGLACAALSKCPSGFECVAGHCWRHDTAPAQGGSGTTGGAGGGGTGGATDAAADRTSTTDGAADASGCNMPLCTARVASGCDPVCQTGCGCKEKCSRGADGSAVCQPLGGFQKVGDSCTPQSAGTAQQSDNCVAGAVCLSDFGTSNARCFALCGGNPDCASYGSLCVNRYLAASDSAPFVSVCDPPVVACDPFASGVAGCLNCQLTEPSSTGKSQTVCQYWSGPRVRDTDLCQSSGDCSGRLVCPQLDAGRFHVCSHLCDMSGSHGCPVGSTCVLVGDKYGYCVP